MSLNTLTPTPLGVAIVNITDGTITDFERLWRQHLIDNAVRIGVLASASGTGKTAAVGTTTLFTTVAAGNYRLAVFVLKTIADGVASSLTVTIGFTSRGVAVTKTFTAFTTDTVGANDSTPWTFYCDGAVGITYQIAYASTTPAKMTWNYDVCLESLA